MTVLHLVSNRVLPFPGGLQESALRIGGSLARAGYRVIVYTLHQPADYRFSDPSHEGMTLIHLDDQDALLDPYRGDEHSDLRATELRRLSALQLQNAIDRQIQTGGGDRHLLISFYASGTGFTAQMTATALGIPHLASVRGTDFELDVFGAKQHPRLRAALEGADQIVTTNRGQAAAIATLFRVRRPIRTIHNALPSVESRPLWTAPPGDPVRLVSDCGFSGRKATHLLLKAVADLIDRGLPVSLTVFGGAFFVESQSYWDECRQSYLSRYPDRISFPGHVTHAELDRNLLSSHIYCSASLAEGSSMSRIRAMTIGIPIVTTATGTMPELAAGCRHVRLCRAGEWETLAAELEAAVSEIRAGTLQPDPEFIERWRSHFSIERERDEWIAAIDAALAGAPEGA